MSVRSPLPFVVVDGPPPVRSRNRPLDLRPRPVGLVPLLETRYSSAVPFRGGWAIVARHAGPCCAAAVVHVDRRRDEVVVVVVDGDDVEVIGYGSGPTDIDAVVASIDTAPVWGGVDDETTAPDHRTAATTATATGGEHLSGTFDGVSVRWDVTGGAK